MFHIAIRHGHADYIRRIIEFVNNNPDVFMNEQAMQEKRNCLDIESDQEKCTPYMLAVLRE